MSRIKIPKRQINSTITRTKNCATNDNRKSNASANFAARYNVSTPIPSRFDTVTFDGFKMTTVPNLPCKERHNVTPSMDNLLREETASPEPLIKPRRRGSLLAGFDRMSAEAASSEPLAMPVRSE